MYSQQICYKILGRILTFDLGLFYWLISMPILCQEQAHFLGILRFPSLLPQLNNLTLIVAPHSPLRFGSAFLPLLVKLILDEVMRPFCCHILFMCCFLRSDCRFWLGMIFGVSSRCTKNPTKTELFNLLKFSNI